MENYYLGVDKESDSISDEEKRGPFGRDRKFIVFRSIPFPFFPPSDCITYIVSSSNGSRTSI